MSTDLNILDPARSLWQFALNLELIDPSANTPLQRWLQFQAYAELVGLLSVQGRLPEGYELDTLDMASIKEWILGGQELGINFVEKMKQLLRKLKETGDRALEEICDFYCEYKAKMGAVASGATVLLNIKNVKIWVAQYKFDALLFHGVPVTTFASLAIQFGLLDGICECPKPVMEPRKS
jgi:hypothetical protein